MTGTNPSNPSATRHHPRFCGERIDVSLAGYCCSTRRAEAVGGAGGQSRKAAGAAEGGDERTALGNTELLLLPTETEGVAKW